MCLALAGLLSVWAGGAHAEPTPTGTVITMTATLDWKAPAGSQTLKTTTTESTTVRNPSTPSTAVFLADAPGSQTDWRAGPTACLASGTPMPMPAPVSPQGSTLDPDQPLPLNPTGLYYPGDPLFVQITDKDQNLNPNVRETVDVTVSVLGTSQAVPLRLTESDANSGVFTGFALSTSQADQAGKCTLYIESNEKLHLAYTDPVHPSDQSHDDALVSPYNIAFDSATGKPVNGAEITLVSVQTGQPAAVIGRDGITRFPSTVTSGQDVTDSSGANYPAAAGAYLMPEVKAGSYRMRVKPPSGYRFASAVSKQSLQNLPGAPFVLGPASFGKKFTLDSMQSVGFDLPLDPVSSQLYVTKTASKTVASIGDMIQFTVTVDNTDKTLLAGNVRLHDILPQGFRFESGSARLITTGTSGTASSTPIDPTISDDGQELNFVLGDIAADSGVKITYVVRISAATPIGTAVNRAQGFAAGNAQSNVATAQVQIRNQLMQNVNTIIGRVLIGCGKDATGMTGVRILMEDGSYVVTDAEGRYHFPEVLNGTHVVQLDVASLPPGYEAHACKQNTRRAGSNYSQFVELHGGALWHADFHVRKLPPPEGSVTLSLSQKHAGNILDNTLKMSVTKVPVDNLSATVLLPADSHYVAGSARLDGKAVSDPQVMGSALVFRLGHRDAGWRGKLRYKLTGEKSGEGTTSALLNFDTPGASGQHTPVAKAGPVRGTPQSATTRKATRGLSPGAADASPTAPLHKPAAETQPATKPVVVKPADKSGSNKPDANKPKGIQLDSKWFNAAGAKPEFVLPKTNANPSTPAIRVAVKHAPGQSVHLSINGKPVSPRNMLGVKTNSRRTASVSEWLGVPVVKGDNQLAADIMQGDKKVKRIECNVHFSGSPVRAEIVASKSLLVADGKTRPHVAVRLYDRWGYPVREGLTGHFTLSAPYKSWRSIKELQQHPLAVTGAERQPTYTVGKDGIAIVELAPTTHTGRITLTFPLADGTRQQLQAWVKPGKRDWILVGLATGSLAFNKISGHMQTLSDDDPNSDIFQDGRIAFYAKGTIQGKYLLTLAYDTAKKEGLSPSGLKSLGQQIDPNQYFVLYGDASHEGHDAQSNSKLYVKIERGQFNALFGIYNTGLTVTKLARYSRRFNGLKSEYQGKHIGYTAFAARNAQSFVKDEIRGNGTSGLYHLSHRLILVNSERIKLITRDRYHSQQIVSSQPLSRYVDYSIDYTTGTIFFKQPVPSVDANLNPVYIVASYEVQNSGKKSVTAGGRVSWRSTDKRVEVGATLVDEGTQADDNRLAGVDLRLELGKSNELKAEVAHTRTGAAGNTSLLTGYAPNANAAAGNNDNSSAMAWRVNLKHRGKRLQGELYARQLDKGFGLGQQLLGESGTRKLGARGSYVINKYWRINNEIWTEKSMTNDTSRNAAEVSARWHKDNNSITIGLRHAYDHFLNPSTYGSTPPVSATASTPAPVKGSGSSDQVQLGGSTTVFDGKLKLHALTSRNIGSSGDAAWPSMTTLGADYAVTKSTTLFLAQDFSSGNNVAGSRATRLGVRSKPWDQAELTTALSRRSTEYGPRLFSTTGLTQGWNVNKHLTLNAGFNRSHSLSGAPAPSSSTGAGGTQTAPGSINPGTPPVAGVATADFTSAFFGAGWQQKDWSATARIEGLDSASEHRLALLGGVYHQLSKGNGMAANMQLFHSKFNAGGALSRADLRLSFAHRPDGGHWAVLEQLDFIYANQQGLAGSLFLGQGSTGTTGSQGSDQTPADLAAAQGTPSSLGINQRSRKLVNNLQLNYHGDNSEWSVYLGLKYATYAFDVGNYSSLTSLVNGEYRFDITPHWDFGVIAGRLTTWRSGVSKNRIGVELGHTFGKNMWVSLGYNFSGFTDRDFSGAGYTSQGLFLRFRMKFDQDSVKHLLGFGD